jgi:SmpA / OmlA family
MKTLITKLLAATLLGVLTGCASYSGSSLIPGQSSQADTRALMGEPAGKYAAFAGEPFAESWEYPRGPSARHTFMARFDKSGKLVVIDQVLTVETAAKIKIGSARHEDVLAILGHPGAKSPDRRGGEYWDYAAFSNDGAPRKIRIVVTFDKDGVATAAGETYDPEDQSPNFGGGGSTL